MNIIFLDVDGVLNSERSSIAGSSRMKAYQLANTDAPYYKVITKYTIDPIAVDMINKIAHDFDAGFCISSSQHTYFPDNQLTKLSQLQEYFQFLGIDGYRIIGWTPTLLNTALSFEECKGWLETRRGLEIANWIDIDGSVKNYVIIDDSADMLESQKENFVKVNPDIGFSAQNYRDATHILGRKNCD